MVYLLFCLLFCCFLSFKWGTAECSLNLLICCFYVCSSVEKQNDIYIFSPLVSFIISVIFCVIASIWGRVSHSTVSRRTKIRDVPQYFLFCFSFARRLRWSGRYGWICKARRQPQPAREETRSPQILLDLINQAEAAGSSNTCRGASDTLTPPLASAIWHSARAPGRLQPRSLLRPNRLHVGALRWRLAVAPF